MTFEECMNLVGAFEHAVLLSSNEAVRESTDLSGHADCVKDSLGEFICSLLFESPIGDRGRHDAR